MTDARLPTRAGSCVTSGLLVAVVVAIALYPVLWMIVSSLRPDGHIFGNPSLVLDTFETANYPHGWNALGRPFGWYLLNSAIIVLGAIVGNLVSCSMAAYAFARLRFRFQRAAFAIMLVTHHAADPRRDRAAVRPLRPARHDQLVLAADPAEVPRRRRVLHLPDGPVHPRPAPGAGRGGPDRRRRPRPDLPPGAAAADETGAGDHGDLHLHLDLERLLQPAGLPDRAPTSTPFRSRCAPSSTRSRNRPSARCSP